MKTSAFIVGAWLLGVMTVAAAETQTKTDRVIIADFEDVGTWRAREISGIPPEGWFSGTLCLASSESEHCRGKYVGALDYMFGGPGPYEISLEREKMSRTSAFIRAIEFEANPKGVESSLKFDLEDANGRRFRTTKVNLQGDKWETYHLDINAQTVPRFAEMQFPAVLRKIYFSTNAPGTGRIYIDDLRLIGRVSRAHKLSIFPIYRGINYDPSAPIELTYRISNAAPEKVDAEVQFTSSDVRGGESRQRSQKISIPAAGETEVTFAIGTLPVGSYTARVTVDGGDLKATYMDWFGVFVPNGQRPNKKPMWFGLQDTTTWQGESENTLHRTWMKALGVDLIRVGIAGLWTEPVRGQKLNQPLARMLRQLNEAGLDTYLLYSDAVPVWTMATPGWRKAPTDWAAFDEHVSHLGAYLAAIPGVKYLEMWNEPDLDFYQGSLDEYLHMLKSFSEHFKPAAPNIKLVSGGLTILHPAEKKGFSKAVVQQAALCDITGFHNHGPLSSYAQRQGMVEEWLKEVGVNHPIANTEAGARSYYDDLNGALTQTITLIQKIVYAKSRPTTEFYTWYILQDYWDMDTKADDSLGLVTSDNRAKPSFVAYNELIRRLANTEPQGEVSLNPDVVTYAFRRSDTGQIVYVCWPKPGRSNGRLWIKAAGEYLRADVFGRVEKLATDKSGVFVAVTALPLYLQSVKADDKLQAFNADQADFNVPESFYATGSKTDLIPVQVRNRTASKMTYRATILDERGTAIGTQTAELTPNSASTLSVSTTLPVTDNYQVRNVSVQIQSSGTTEQTVQLPLAIRYNYPIALVKSAAQVADLAAISLDKADDVRELAFDPFIPQWRGPDDLSMKLRMAHDGKTLFVQCDVTDSQHVQNHPASEMWKGDSVQIAMTNPAGKLTEFTMGLTSSGAAVWGEETPTAGLKGQWNVPAQITREGHKTLYRVEIPLENLGLSFNNEPVPFHLAVVLNNDNGQGRIRYMQWFSGMAMGKDPEAFGFVRLESTPVAEKRP